MGELLNDLLGGVVERVQTRENNRMVGELIEDVIVDVGKRRRIDINDINHQQVR